MNNDSIVKISHVNKRYVSGEEQAIVLKDVNFKIKKNAFTIIYGPSGSGKTTILNMIMGLLAPTSGQVEVDGYDMYSLSRNERAKFRAKNFGSVYQTNNWINSLNVIENVALPLYLSGYDRSSALKLAKESLTRVGMEKYALYMPTVLSVGQQQRVSMARATVSNPLLLVADEPTGNLDTKNGDMIMKLIMSYKNDHNATVILVTHNMDYLPLSDHRLFIQDGVVTEDAGGYRSDINESFNKVSAMLGLGRSAQKVNKGSK